MFHPLSTFKISISLQICIVQWQGNMVQITVPKKLEKQFRQQLAEGEKYVSIHKSECCSYQTRDLHIPLSKLHSTVPTYFKSATSSLNRIKILWLWYHQ
jgi:hypothetical protein